MKIEESYQLYIGLYFSKEKTIGMSNYSYIFDVIEKVRHNRVLDILNFLLEKIFLTV